MMLNVCETSLRKRLGWKDLSAPSCDFPCIVNAFESLVVGVSKAAQVQLRKAKILLNYTEQRFQGSNLRLPAYLLLQGTCRRHSHGICMLSKSSWCLREMIQDACWLMLALDRSCWLLTANQNCQDTTDHFIDLTLWRPFLRIGREHDLRLVIAVNDAA